MGAGVGRLSVQQWDHVGVLCGYFNFLSEISKIHRLGTKYGE